MDDFSMVLGLHRLWGGGRIGVSIGVCPMWSMTLLKRFQNLPEAIAPTSYNVGPPNLGMYVKPKVQTLLNQESVSGFFNIM